MEGIAYSKLLLFGEHAALYGYPALGIPLPDTLVVRLRPGRQHPGRQGEVEITGIPGHLVDKTRAFIRSLITREVPPYCRFSMCN